MVKEHIMDLLIVGGYLSVQIIFFSDYKICRYRRV